MKITKQLLTYFLIFVIVLMVIFACVFFYSFKTDYKEIVQINAKQNNIDESLIFAIIKAESKFNAKAQSKKGAIGLMQLMPNTANFVLQNCVKNNSDTYEIINSFMCGNEINNKTEFYNLKIISNKIISLLAKGQVQKNDLVNPEINIFLGVKYFKYLIDKFKNVDVAICAYNAGETNVRAWLNDEEYSCEGQTLDNIPFIETKNYLKKVKFNKKIYKKMLNY